MELYLPIPIFESHVSGLTLEFDHIQRNILNDHPRADLLAEEQLWLTVQHDGSNPFCSADKCCWQMLFVPLITDIPISVVPESDALTQLICIPRNKKLGKVEIEEGLHNGIAGIWLIVELHSQDTDDEYDLGFNLVPYSIAG
jgi:hypothetical protein